MKITRVEAIALSAPFEKIFGSLDRVPAHLLRPAANQVSTPRLGQATCVIRVHTDEGLIGLGESYGLPAPEISAVIVSKHLARLIVGRDPRETGVLWDRMYSSQRGGGQTGGFMLQAMAGIDIALWDIRARAAGQSIAAALGGRFRDRIPVYASPVPFLPEPERSAEAARAFVKQGFRAIKLKVGRGVNTDVDHVAAVREAIGPDVKLMLDVNCGYDVRTAIRASIALRPYDVFWLEEPLPPEDVEGLAEVRRRADMAVVMGECEFTAFHFKEFLSRGATDTVQPNITRAGGITECWRIGELARLYNISVSPHGVGSGIGIAASLQWCAAVPNLGIYEYNRLLNPLRDAVLNEKLDLREGELMVPSGDGLGVTLNEDAIEQYITGRY